MQKNLLFFLFFILAVCRLTAQTGFTSVTQLTPVPITTSTKDKPQSKVWTYAGKWWCVLATSQGTRIFRLDGTAWTPILTLANTSSSKPDCRVVGDLVHVLVYRGSSNNSIIYSVQYDPASGTYKLWGQRSTGVSLHFPQGSATATLAVDGTGRMWVASDAISEINVWYSDAPYTTWSGPITIATGMKDDDICAIAKLPGKIGVFWSNQVTKRFGFKTHDDGTDPNTWSADEVPASQSANDGIGNGMADDHMNIKVASDGTLYCGAKTSFAKTGHPRLILLIRRPNGTWDDVHPITMYPEGEKPVVLLNEAQNKLKIIYTSRDGGGDILYRESAISNIAFGNAINLISETGKEFDHTTSTHQNYNPDVVILATNQTTNSLLAEGVLASDDASDNIPPVVSGIDRFDPASELTNAGSVIFKVSFSESVNGVDVGDFVLTTSGTASGSIASVSSNGDTYQVTVNTITGQGTLRLDLNASGTGITDLAGNAINGGFTTGETYHIDRTSPAVTNINRFNPADENTTATSVTFRAIFSEAVIGVDAADFSLTTGGSAGGTISSVSGTGDTYDVTVNTITGTGTLRLDLNGSGTGITDAVGNPVSGGFTTGQSYSISVSPPPVVYGFTSVTQLTPFDIGGGDTQHKPQAKTWTYNGKWWCVFAVPDGGNTVMKLFRLDGDSWTPVLNLGNFGGRPDCLVVGDIVHLLIHRGNSASGSFLYSLQYNPSNNAYQLWGPRPTRATFFFPAGTTTATLAIDGTGRMWVATDGVSEINAWYADAPYSTWSGPVNIATGVDDEDICAVTKLQGKIGIFWSNKNTGLFGFKTHNDGAAANDWSADEIPASQSAIPGNPRMADNHMSLVPASDGTLYCAIKTAYNAATFIQVGLMVRRPDGTWDDLYPVVVDDGSREGTQPIVILNETMGKVKVVFTTVTNGGEIAYKESLTSNISFGAKKILITGGSFKYNFSTSTHQTYNPEVVILATDMALTGAHKLMSVLASDASVSLPGIVANDRQTMPVENMQANSLRLYPNPFTNTATLSFTLPETGMYSVSLYDSKGGRLSMLKQGWGTSGMPLTMNVDGSRLGIGMYIISIQTNKSIQVIKMLKN